MKKIKCKCGHKFFAPNIYFVICPICGRLLKIKYKKGKNEKYR